MYTILYMIQCNAVMYKLHYSHEEILVLLIIYLLPLDSVSYQLIVMVSNLILMDCVITFSN